MSPRVRWGLIIGVIALVFNICVSLLFGICGPLVGLIAGALAGFFAAREEKPPVKGDGAKAGAVSGAIAGVLVLVGQLIGGVGALIFFGSAAMQAFGVSPGQPGGTTSATFWLAGLGTGLCFGIVDIALAAGVGALAGYLAAPTAPAQS
ncbi:MAG: hypothetical protein KGJ80_03480 [Chloroflexota bacterium]|nr:hypothetical protein [Chloroflexota bacterium]